MIRLTDLKGVGPKTLEKLSGAGINTLQDLLCWYPRDYISYEEARPIGDLAEDETAIVEGHFRSTPVTRRYGGKTITSGTFTDGTGSLSVSWFHMPYIASSLGTGQLFLRGKVLKKGSRLCMYQPSVMQPDQYESLRGRMTPIYPLKGGLTNKLLISLIEQVLDLDEMHREYLPDALRSRYQLASADYAARQIHFPDSYHDMMIARKRLVFDEFFLFILSVRMLRDQQDQSRNAFDMGKSGLVGLVREKLPYELTGAQAKALGEILGDMDSDHVMNRLLQGDVGCGKTAVALLAMVHAAENGYQSVLMAPTEVLAQQHYQNISKFLEDYGLPFQAVILTGSMKVREKRAALEAVRNQEAQIIIGTHALIQEKVEYHDLALVITDEQHRFGVRQRAALSEKALGDKKPHVLVMSATPIPRTLALILYGDLDISVIDQLPANRIPIKNTVVGEEYLPRIYAFLTKQIREGRQVYVICPMIEESEAVDAENVLESAETLRQKLPKEFTIACLHGKMKAAEKNRIMQSFSDGEIDVLVSTTVVEVGVNVPNASVMLIENAERFGLSQLHQLRGRVGRGRYQSYCIFLDRSGRDDKSERLKVMEKSNDGFFIASEDLRLRGPGDFYGTRQNGRLAFRLADIYTDAGIMKEAAAAADLVTGRKLSMTDEEAQLLEELLREYQDRADTANVPI
ncbi:MAG: ATP-dependent DNA helicase RecG [Lachnospiraceae bacterium]